MACRGFLQCLLKLFNLTLALVGVLLLVFSVSLLVREESPTPPPPAPAPSSPAVSVLPETEAPGRLQSLSAGGAEEGNLYATREALALPQGRERRASQFFTSLAHAQFALPRPLGIQEPPEGKEGGPRSSSSGSIALRTSPEIQDPQIPELWFTYLLVGAGAYITLLTLVGAIAAESNLSCCLSTYQFGLCFLLLLQLVAAALVWLQEVPPDPTGEYERRRQFVLQNLELCKLAAMCLLLVEGTALLLAMMLRAIQADEATAEAEEEDYVVIPRRQLGAQQRGFSYNQPQLGVQQSGATTVLGSTGSGTAVQGGAGGPSTAWGMGSATPHSDTWRTRLMEKYGMDPGELQYGTGDSRGNPLPLRSAKSIAAAPFPAAQSQEGEQLHEARGSGACTIM